MQSVAFKTETMGGCSVRTRVSGCGGSRLSRRRLRSSAAVVSLIALPSLLAADLSVAQPAPETEPLPQVTVVNPRPRPPTRPKGTGKKSVRPAPAPAPAQPVTTVEVPSTATVTTPLNTNVVAGSASRLGLTVRETPASIDVVDQQKI